MTAQLPKQTSSSNEQSWICPNCGKRNRSNRSFCWNCEAPKDALEFIPSRPQQNSRPQLREQSPPVVQLQRCPHCGAESAIARDQCIDCGSSLIGLDTITADADPEPKHGRITGTKVLSTALIIVGATFVAALIKIAILWIQGYYQGQDPYLGNTIQRHLAIISFLAFLQVMGILIIARAVQLFQGKARPISLLGQVLGLPRQRSSEKIRAIGMVIVAAILLYYTGPALILFVIYPVEFR